MAGSSWLFALEQALDTLCLLPLGASRHLHSHLESRMNIVNELLYISCKLGSQSDFLSVFVCFVTFSLLLYVLHHR